MSDTVNNLWYQIIKTPTLPGPKRMRYCDDIADAHNIFDSMLIQPPMGTVRLYVACGKETLEMIREETQTETTDADAHYDYASH